MFEKDVQEWEEHETRLPDDSAFAQSTPAAKRPDREFRQINAETAGEFEGPFLVGESGEAATETRSIAHRRGASGDCGCGGKSTSQTASSEAATFETRDFEAPSYESASTEIFHSESILPEAFSGETFATETATETEAYAETEGLEEAENESETSGCAPGCPEPSAAEKQRIRRKGTAEGAFIERTEGDRRVNFALQLFDYDVNEYRPLKNQHREALTRIREFIVQRTVRTDQRIVVTITGLASRTGARGYNDVLSCKRAECAADNLRQSLSFFRGVSDRVQINARGEGFARATCKGSDCELGEWRSVLIQVHTPGNIPEPVPPIDPGWDKYEIRCCSYHTKTIAEASLGDLLNKLPGIPANLRGKLIEKLRQGLSRLLRELQKRLPRALGELSKGLSELLKLFPAEIIRETGVFEIREREKQNARSTTLCYTGHGLRIIFPRKNTDEFLDETIGKVGFFRILPDAIKKQVCEAIKKSIPDFIKTAVQPIESDSPGPFARFNLLHARNIRVFAGTVQTGKGIWMPGQVNVEFNSPPWTRPDPVQRPRILNCPDTDCNDAGVQSIVGAGKGLELFSITTGDLVAGSCACTASAKEFETESEAGEMNETESWLNLAGESASAESEGISWPAESYELESYEAESKESGEAYEADPYASIRSAMSPEHADLAAHEVTPALGRMPATLVLHQMLNSPEMQQATVASVLGNSGQRSVRVNGTEMSIPTYLRMGSRLCREVAEQSETEDPKHPGAPSNRLRGVMKYPEESRQDYYAFYQTVIQGVAGKPKLSSQQKADLAEKIADACMSRFKLHAEQMWCAIKSASNPDDKRSLNNALNLTGPWGETFRGALPATTAGDYDWTSPDKPVKQTADIADQSLLALGQLDENLWGVFAKCRQALTVPDTELQEFESVFSERQASDETAPGNSLRANLVLHQLINSAETKQATMACLLGGTGRRTVRVNGADIPIPVWLRMVSRLCREVAEQSEAETPGIAVNEEFAPVQDQFTVAGGPATLTGSVGRKGSNRPDDVKLVQRLLNANLPLPAPLLQENGVIDADTISAIENYQRRTLARTPDGRIDPRGTAFGSLTADKLCFLPHFCQPSGGGSAVSVNATSMNPGFMTASGVTRNSGLQDIVDRRILANHPRLSKLRFALVDLTGASKLASPQFAGHRETEQGGLGSMSKLACMYAAYQLKFDLEELSRRKNITDRNALFAAARTLWNDAQRPDAANVAALFPADPKIELFGKLIAIDDKPVTVLKGFSVPVLDRIFDAVPGGVGGLTLRFKGSDRILVDPTVPGSPPDDTPDVKGYVRRGGDDLRAVRRLSFAERLFLMIDDSDNSGAHSCIEDVSFLYLTSAIWQSDFYRPERGGGLWESSTHDTGGSRWMKPPVPKHNPKADFVSANAASIAALLTLLEQGRLVNRDASAGMKHIMNKSKSGVSLGSNTRSYFLEGLAPLFTIDRFHSKLGIGTFLNDCAIVVRTVTDPADSSKTKQIRYVATGFDDPSPSNRPAVHLHALIVELDKCIRENNGLLSATDP